MAYAPPPGTNSLPARPPPAFSSSSSSPIPPASPSNSSNSNINSNTVRHGFRPAFASAQTYQAPPSYPPGAANYAANNYSAQSHFPSRSQYGASSQYGSTASYPSSSSSSSYGPVPGVSSSGYGYASQQPQPQHQQRQPHQQGYGSQNASNYAPQTVSNSYAPPQIQNPFPAPGTAAASAIDPSEAAQIAEWQSAYNAAPQTAGRDGKPLTLVSEPSKPEPSAAAAAATTNPDKKKTVVRHGGGKKWTDDTLLEWDPSHLRLFVGNLAGETTDESLLKAFVRWKSVQKARVIRDKRTTKSKGYGFVSFSNADDFFQAAKEMNGKYIQSHPVVVRKANTEIKVSNVKDKTKSTGKQQQQQHNSKNKNSKKNHHGHSVGGGGYEPSLGPVPGSGVTKPGQKTKNGLRLLG
ncbi:hypothetical protein L249_3374 [Ophiocordyceps polyrhachis-furcata BCC 54312]|uniref:RRM domain-containing protein n=1 Tax=Ophiocordyceps polyrhachis-furcata BCC 54312 TaxID=1330021 RepID=A0A367LMJ8_9HYPO|nr:hypothetical protein L249_3374 [Ophiocordyceps polyrhachis-furcata BCC 54312]